MILHAVYLRLKPEHDRVELATVMNGLTELVSQVDGIEAFEHGPNIDAEGKSPGFPYGFLCRFSDSAALDRYAADPRHRALSVRLVALCAGGGDGIMVFDLDTETDR